MDATLGIFVRDVTVERRGFKALTDISFEVVQGTLMGVLGPNGAGKSTLFDAIAGILPIASGTVDLRGADTRNGTLAYVPQRDASTGAFRPLFWTS